MRKLITLYLILMIALIFVACDSTTKTPVEPTKTVEEGVKDPNVPPTSEFKDATEEEIALMKSMMAEMPNRKEYLISSDMTMTFECLEGAKINGKSASGKLVASSNQIGKTTQIKFSGKVTLDNVTYNFNDYSSTVIMGEDGKPQSSSISGSISDSTGKEYNETDAMTVVTSMENSLMQSENEKIKITTFENYTYKNADKKTQKTQTLSGVSDDFENKYYSSQLYYVIENAGHKMTLGETDKNDGENGKGFIYLSLDGKYFKETVYNEVIKVRNQS